MNWVEALQILISLSLSWAPSVHDAILQEAFPAHTMAETICLLNMQKGSREADKMPYLLGRYSYMHAMRGPQDKTEAAASRRTWNFISDQYTEVRNAVDQNPPEICEQRGFALHPVMDATSPVHRGYQEWNLLSHPMDILEHGDLALRIVTALSLGKIIKSTGSQEDWNYLESHTWEIFETAALIRTIDEILQKESIE